MDTYTRPSLDFKTPTHPTQGNIPFSATQSLRLCLPFQCYSRCSKKKTNPSRFVYEVPSYTRFIKLLRKCKGRMAKLVAHSRAKDTSIRSICLGIHNTCTPNTRKHPLLCYTVPQYMPFLLVLFRLCRADSPSTLIFL